MKKTTNKVILVGAGAVGTSFLYSAINRGIAEEYGIIDLNKEVCVGNEMDLEDAFSVNPSPAVVKAVDYTAVKDADVIVITAGRPQKPGETRLNMVSDNAKIMKSVATQIKENGFNGITIIASNPVDIMTAVYQKVTGYDAHKVISSSCSLDTSRLRFALAKEFNVSPTAINAFVLGEHGDSSVSTFKYASIDGVPLKEHYAEKGLDDAKLEDMHKQVWKKAYEIIDRKRATFYGIGAVLAQLVKVVLRDEKRVFSVGTLLTGEYGHTNVYAGVPCVLGREGVIKTYEFPLSEKEKEQLNKSITTLKEVTHKAFEAIE